MAEKSIIIVFKSDGMGVTDNQGLREVLARKFLALIADADMLPRAICFYTDGVKLACEGSPILAIGRDLGVLVGVSPPGARPDDPAKRLSPVMDAVSEPGDAPLKIIPEARLAELFRFGR